MRIFRSEYREYSAALGGSCAIWKFAAAGISLVTGSRVAAVETLLKTHKLVNVYADRVEGVH